MASSKLIDYLPVCIRLSDIGVWYEGCCDIVGRLIFEIVGFRPDSMKHLQGMRQVVVKLASSDRRALFEFAT
jgi:hypothetical protein